MKTFAIVWFTLLRGLAVLVDFRGDRIWFALAFYR